MGVPLVFAGCDYPDRTVPLIDGRVKAEGIDLRWLVDYPGDMFRRMLQFEEFDASEMSIGFYTAVLSRGDRRFVGIPAFLIGHFRHGYIFVRTDGGIEKPSDLAGRRVGLPEDSMTAGLWVRALLQHEYGVKPQDVHWHQGGWESPGFASRFPLDIPPEFRITTIPEDKTLVGQFLDGELDALVGPGVPTPFKRGDKRIKRLLPNYRELERDYYRRTGLFPKDHMVVIRREVYEKNRWMAVNLYRAFNQAKEIGWNQFVAHSSLVSPLPWITSELDEIQEVFGGNPYQYGFQRNLPVVEAITQYCFEQGIAKRKVDPTELFAPETLGNETH